MNKRDGNERISAQFSNIEQMFVDAYAVEPARSFVNRLEKDLLAGKVRARRLLIPMSTRLAWAAAAFVVLLAVLLATPQGRAFAQEILHFFTRGGSDSLPALPTPTMGWVNVAPGGQVPTSTPMAPFADCGDFSLANGPKCSVEEIRSRVDFRVEELGAIPEGMHFVGATGGPDFVLMLYTTEYQRGWLSIAEMPAADNPQPSQVGASASVEPVQVGEVTGEYVLGAFVGTITGPTMNWDPYAGIQTLVWSDQGVIYWLSASGIAIRPRDEFVVLAESLTTEPVSANLPAVVPAATATTIEYYNFIFDLRLSQAEDQAGFDLLEPTKLPEILTLAGASYVPEGRMVRIFYPDRIQPEPGEFRVGLVVSEQPIPAGGECDLCGYQVMEGDATDGPTARSGRVVGASAVIETVQVAGSAAQYVEGWWFPASTAWAWVNRPIVKTLRWQATGMAFELQYTGASLTLADLIAIAESIK